MIFSFINSKLPFNTSFNIKEIVTWRPVQFWYISHHSKTLMFLFSTVLFIDGNPIGYEVLEEKSRLRLNPAENPNRDVQPPTLSARITNGKWQVEGTLNRDLIDQVIEGITMNMNLSRHGLTAAP